MAEILWLSSLHSKVLKPQDDALDDALENRMFIVLKENLKRKQMDLVAELNTSRATVQRLTKTLTDRGKLSAKVVKKTPRFTVNLPHHEHSRYLLNDD